MLRTILISIVGAVALAAAIRPSIDIASLSIPSGRPRVSRVMNPSLSRSASSSSTPAATSIFARLRIAIPRPRTRGSGSTHPLTTRLTPAATSALAHGGVLPKWAQGSNDTYAVARRARVGDHEAVEGVLLLANAGKANR